MPGDTLVSPGQTGANNMTDSMAFVPSLEQIFEADDTPRENVPVPEWGGEGAFIPIEGFTGMQRAYFQKKREEGTLTDEDFIEEMIVACAKNSDGQPLFNRQHIAELKKRSAKVTARLMAACLRVNGLDDTAIEVTEGN